MEFEIDRTILGHCGEPAGSATWGASEFAELGQSNAACHFDSVTLPVADHSTPWRSHSR